MARLWKSSKFWLAMLAMVQTILFQFVPSFPESVWLSIDVVLIVVIGTICAEDVATKSNTVQIVETSVESKPDCYAGLLVNTGNGDSEE